MRKNRWEIVRVRFLQNGFFVADFYSWATGFFADFVAGSFLLIVVVKSAQKNPLGKSSAKSSKTYATKSSTHFWRGAGPKIAEESASNNVGQFWGAGASFPKAVLGVPRGAEAAELQRSLWPFLGSSYNPQSNKTHMNRDFSGLGFQEPLRTPRAPKSKSDSKSNKKIRWAWMATPFL